MDRLSQKRTLPGVFISLMVHQVSNAAAVVEPLLVIKGFERLTGAVRLLRWHTALVCIEGRGVVLRVFGATTLRQRAVPVVL